MEKRWSCPRCISTSTTEKSHDRWRCRECGYDFDVPDTGKKRMQKATDARRKMQAGRSARAS